MWLFVKEVPGRMYLFQKVRGLFFAGPNEKNYCKVFLGDICIYIYTHMY